MPKINLSVPHQLSQDEAKERISRLIAEGRAQAADQVSDVVENWSGYVDTLSFRARGFAVQGRIEVHPARVAVEMHLPFAAFPFKSRIEQELRERAERLLA